jgi:hypothetical protein
MQSLNYNEYSDKCKKTMEDKEKLAPWVVKKLDTENREWIIKNTENEELFLIEAGDMLEILTQEESFDTKANYQGSLKTIVVDTSHKQMLKLKLPSREAHLIGEGQKVFSYYKPFYVEEKSYNFSNTTVLSVLTILSLLIIIFILSL